MNTLNPYILKLQTELVDLSKWEYFQPTILIITITVFFLLGRRTYESKFSHVLNTINDVQNQKKKLKEEFQKLSASQRFLQSKKTLFKLLTIFILAALGAYTYLYKFNVFVVAGGVAFLVVMWVVIVLRLKYVSMKSKSTDARLQRKSLSAQSDTKQIMNLLGDELCRAFKQKFERQLQIQWQTDELKECDLKKCSDEKKYYKQLYQLYKDIVSEIKVITWCDVCSNDLNIDVNQIKLAEIEGRIRMYRAAGDKITLEKKKELTNRLLEEWQILESKLPKMCKRGCCLRFRTIVEQIKKKNNEHLKDLKNKLSLVK